MIIDSGHQSTSGAQSNYYYAYKALIDAELPRGPQAEVDATYKRVSNHFDFVVNVTNHSGVTLSSDYDANVYGIVYEDVVPISVDPTLKTGVTSRLVRAVVSAPITSLADDAADTYPLPSTANLDPAVVDFTKLHMIAFAEYRPGGTTGAYDMLQAAVAVNGTINANPSSLSFTLNPTSPGNPQAPVEINGTPQGAAWHVSSKPAWVTVTPDPGTVGSTITVRVDVSKLIPCKNSGTIVIVTNASPVQTLSIPITVNFSPSASISASPSSFNLVVDPDNPQDLEAAVQLTGAPGIIAWTAPTASLPSWLTVNPTSGTTPGSAVIGVSVSGLQPGGYGGTIRFASSACTAVVRDVPIHVDFPALTVTPDSQSFLIDVDNPTDPEANIQIGGYPDNLPWTVTSHPVWVTITPGDGEIGSSFLVKVNHLLLDHGDNNGQVIVEATYSGKKMTRTISILAVYNYPWPFNLPMIGIQ